MKDSKNDYSLVKKYLSQGFSQNESCRKAGISESSYRRFKTSAKNQSIDDELVHRGLPVGASAAWLKVDGVSALYKRDADKQNWLDDFKADIEKATPKAIRIPKPKTQPKDILPIIYLADIHAGMQAWRHSARKDNDLKICLKRLEDGFGRVLAATPQAQKIVIANLGDTFHADDGHNETPQSRHKLDMDGRHEKIALKVTEMFWGFIEACLERYEEVEYIDVNGNHDETQMNWLAIAIYARFKDCKRVKIDLMDKHKIKVLTFGKNGRWLSHGDKTTFLKLVQVIPALFAREWYETNNRECVTGHVHHEQSKEYPGITCRSIRANTTGDQYSIDHNYLSLCSIRAEVLSFDARSTQTLEMIL